MSVTIILVRCKTNLLLVRKLAAITNLKLCMEAMNTDGLGLCVMFFASQQLLIWERCDGLYLTNLMQ
jgi:hypothetical protein